MFLLVVDENRPERESMARVLEHAAGHVEAVADAKSAFDAIARQPRQLIVLAWHLKTSADFLRKLRAAEAGEHTYVLVVLDRHPPSEITALYAAGADDFLRRPFAREELLGRVEAPKRIQKWGSGLGAQGATGGADLRQFTAVKEMGQLVGKDIAEMLGQEVSVVEGWSPTLKTKLRGATIPMSLASDKTELRISIMVDETSLRSLGTVLLGDENAPNEALDDVLRELANTAGGAVKRTALVESLTLTTGLPHNEAAEPVPSDKTRCWVATLPGANVTLGIVGEIRSRENQRVSATKLREGMVLAHDLRNHSGALLVAAGTRLTATTAERVAGLLGERTLVEVACAA